MNDKENVLSEIRRRAEAIAKDPIQKERIADLYGHDRFSLLLDRIKPMNYTEQKIVIQNEISTVSNSLEFYDTNTSLFSGSDIELSAYKELLEKHLKEVVLLSENEQKEKHNLERIERQKHTNRKIEMMMESRYRRADSVNAKTKVNTQNEADADLEDFFPAGRWRDLVKELSKPEERYGFKWDQEHGCYTYKKGVERLCKSICRAMKDELFSNTESIEQGGVSGMRPKDNRYLIARDIICKWIKKSEDNGVDKISGIANYISASVYHSRD